MPHVVLSSPSVETGDCSRATAKRPDKAEMVEAVSLDRGREETAILLAIVLPCVMKSNRNAESVSM